ncbi:hypothetical protein SpCBS45565_g01165 [Spizellomyces sp. 'palustris']|nr:hypothetical protein SpCBS45565_g01165 [Spizellomyces sp. 'palustris']
MTTESEPTTPRIAVEDVDDVTGIFLDRFEVKRHLGEGSYGKVKLAQDLTSQRMVALKIIQKSSLKKTSHVTRLKREVRIMRLLHHPNITRLYDVMETEKEIVLSMEYVEGGELFDYIVAHKRLKEKIARRLFRQIVSALEYCHQSSIIHRDLKPENLLLDNERNIKIIDFGFVKLYDRNDQLNTFCGSPFYASPEMIMGKQYMGPEVDVWSMGVILFALLNGHLPFRDPNTTELYKKIAAGQYETRTQYMSAESADLIKRMLTVDATKRATIQEIRHHPWVTQDGMGPAQCLVPERPSQILDPDPNVLAKFPMYGIETNVAEKALRSKERGAAWALYCLLIEQEVWEARESPVGSRSRVSDSQSTAMIPQGAVSSNTSPDNGQASPPATATMTMTTTTTPTATTGHRPSNLTLNLGRGSTTRGKWRESWQEGLRTALTPPACPTENPFDSPRTTTKLRRRASATETRDNRTRSQHPPPVSMQSLHQRGTRASSLPRGSLAAAGSDQETVNSGGLSLPNIKQDKNRSPAEVISVSQQADKQQPHLVAEHAAATDSPREGRIRRRPSIAETFSNALNRIRGSSQSRSRRPSTTATSPTSSTPESLRIQTSSPASLARPSKPFGADTTSMKPPEEIVSEIERVLNTNRVQYQTNRYKIHCTTAQSTFEIEICRLKGTNMHALQLSRKKGSSLAYHSICQTLISQWKL